MENFVVQLSRRAEKDLRKVPNRIRGAAQEVFADMEVDPYSGDYKKLQGDEGHRRRIGDYRILFDIDSDIHLVIVRGIRRRGQAYR